MDRFLSLQAFVDIAETRSFAESARRLRISRSVVSDRLRHLEDLLRAQLLHRSTRSVRLTELGEQLFPRYREIVGHLDDLENAASMIRQSLIGRLRICSVTDIGIHMIAPAIATFAALHPELMTELVTENRVVNPATAGFDIAFHVRQSMASDVDEVTIGELTSVYCAAPAYLARMPPIMLPQDIKAHACVNYSLQPNLNEWLFAQAGRTERINVPYGLSSNSGQVLRTFALAGHGIAILPEYRVHDDLREGTLISVLPDWTPPTLRLTATMPRSHRHTTKVQMFLDHVTQHVRREAHLTAKSIFASSA